MRKAGRMTSGGRQNCADRGALPSAPRKEPAKGSLGRLPHTKQKPLGICLGVLFWMRKAGLEPARP